MYPGEERRQGQNRRVHHIDQEEQDHKGDVDQVHRKGDGHGDDPEELDIRGKELIDQKVQIGDQSHQPIFGICQHPPVPLHALEQADMPAPPLFAQIPQLLRHLGPADGVRGVTDSVGNPVLPAKYVQLHHQLHILPHGGGVVASGLDDNALFEQPDGPGNDDASVEFVK